MDERIEIEYQETIVTPNWGGKRIEAIYTMKHVKYGRVNNYRVTCEIAGIQSHDVHLHSRSAEFLGEAHDTNDETLTNDAALELFDTQI